MTKIETLGAHFPDGVDAFITSDEKTCFYLSEFLFSDGLVFVTKKNAYLFTDFRYIEAAEAEAVGCHISVGNRYEEIRGIIAEEGIKTIGFEDDLLSVAGLERFKKEFPSCGFVPMGGTVRTLAEYKTEREMELVRGAPGDHGRGFFRGAFPAPSRHDGNRCRRGNRISDEKARRFRHKL